MTETIEEVCNVCGKNFPKCDYLDPKWKISVEYLSWHLWCKYHADIVQRWVQPPKSCTEEEWLDVGDVDNMSEYEIKQTIVYIRNAIDTHSRLYYKRQRPTLSDRLYDQLFEQLVDLEEEYNMVDDHSPTQWPNKTLNGEL